MSKTTLQLRRGTTSDNSIFTGALGEVVVNTTTNSLVVHDGITVGGWAQAALASPAFSGTPTAPTATTGDNTTKLATTAFVSAAVSAGLPTISVTTNSASGGGSLSYSSGVLTFTPPSLSGYLTGITSTQIITALGYTPYNGSTNPSSFLTSSGILSTITVTNVGGSQLSYNGNGGFTFTQTVASVNSQTGAVVLTTDNIAQGSGANKYATLTTLQSVLGSGGVTNAMLANSTATINGTTVTLGGSSTISAAANTLTGTTLAANVLASSLTSIGTLTTLTVNGSVTASTNIGAISYGGTLNYADTGIVTSMTTSTNSYAQFILQNTSNGNQASSDFVVSSNTGGAQANYGDFGINSTGYVGIGAFSLPGATYLYSQSGDLVIGSQSNNSVHIVTGSATASDAMTITNTGNVGVNNASPAYKLDVLGDTNHAGAIRTNGNAGAAGQVLISKGASTTITVTATASSGTTATLTFATLGFVPFAAGQTIAVASVTPSGYNGTYTVTSCTLTTVVYTTAGSNLGSVGFALNTGTITGTISPQWQSLNSALPSITQLDNFRTKQTGGTNAFNPTNNGSAVTISYPVQVLIYKNGVYQQPWLNNSRTIWNTITKYGDYTVNNAGQVVFTQTPQPTDIINATVLVGNVTNPVYTTYPFNALDIATGT